METIICKEILIERKNNSFGNKENNVRLIKSFIAVNDGLTNIFFKSFHPNQGNDAIKTLVLNGSEIE